MANDERKAQNGDRKCLENQLQLLADVSAACKDTSKVDELCKLSAAMVELYKTINSPILDLFNQINERT